MASSKGAPAPSSFAEGANGIVMAITATMTAPDAGPHLPLLESLLKAVVGQIQGAQGGAPQQPKPPMQGGGMNLNQLQGQPPSPPTAGPGGPGSAGGPPSGMSPSGASADDIRRMMAQQGAG